MLFFAENHAAWYVREQVAQPYFIERAASKFKEEIRLRYSLSSTPVRAALPPPRAPPLHLLETDSVAVSVSPDLYPFACLLSLSPTITRPQKVDFNDAPPPPSPDRIP